MARGESQESRPHGAALAIWTVLGVLVGVVFLIVLLTTRSCADSASAPSVDVEPPISPPPIVWRTLARNDLERRGYLPPEASGASYELPVTVRANLGEGCGLVIARPVGTAYIRSAQVDALVSVIAVEVAAGVGACGDSAVRFEGVGQVRIERWRHPDLSRATVTALEMPADAALAHAEAERLLVDRAYEPGRQVVLAVATTVPLVPDDVRPAQGCVALVWVRTQHASPTVGSVVRCADGRGGAIPIVDAAVAETRYAFRVYAAPTGAWLPATGAPPPTMVGVERAAWADLELPPGPPSARRRVPAPE